MDLKKIKKEHIVFTLGAIAVVAIVLKYMNDTNPPTPRASFTGKWSNMTSGTPKCDGTTPSPIPACACACEGGVSCRSGSKIKNGSGVNKVKASTAIVKTI